MTLQLSDAGLNWRNNDTMSNVMQKIWWLWWKKKKKQCISNSASSSEILIPLSSADNPNLSRVYLLLQTESSSYNMTMRATWNVKAAEVIWFGPCQ